MMTSFLKTILLCGSVVFFTLENQRVAAPASATYNGPYANDILHPRLVSECTMEYILCATRPGDCHEFAVRTP
jgi:hypothetical protein